MQSGTNRARASVRKLGGQNGQGSSGQAGGAEQQAWNLPPAGNEGGAPQGQAGGMPSGTLPPGEVEAMAGQDGSQKKQQPADWERRLERPVAQVIEVLHQAKEELAHDLEANLKQLKKVLEESQRIQRQMEAVLREARNTPDPKERATGAQPERPKEKGEAKQGAGKKGAKQAEGKQGEAKPGGEAQAAGEQKGGEQQAGGQQGAQSGADTGQPGANGGQAGTIGGQAGQQPGQTPTQGWQIPAWNPAGSGPAGIPPWEPPDLTQPGQTGQWEPPVQPRG